MVSNTQQSDRRRALRHKAAGKRAATKREKLGSTPRFPLQPEGYDPNAPDAKPASPADSTGSGR